MGFVAPIWLLLALSGLGVLYLHVRRRTIVELPSLDLWQRVASGRARKRPFRLPPWSLALLLQLAVVALLALALAEPMLGRQETAHRVFVLDARALSASIDEIKGLLATAPPDGANPVSLVTAGPSPRIVAARLDDRAAVDASLGSIEPQDGGIDLIRTEELVASLGEEGEATAVAWLEGRTPGTIDAQLTHNGDRWQLSGSVFVAAGLNKPAALKVLFMPDGTPGFLDWSDVPLEFDGDSAPLSSDLDLPQAGVLSLLLPDGSAGMRFKVQPEAEETRILYIGKPTPAVVRALMAVPDTRLFQADQLPDADSEFDLVVADNVALPRPPETNVLYVGSGHVASWDAPMPIEATSATLWRDAHPLSDGVEWSGITSIKGFSTELRRGSEELLGAGGRTIVQARTLRTGREVTIGLDLNLTPWAEDPSYVALIANIVRWAGLGNPAGAIACTTGQTCQVPANLLAGSIESIPESVLAKADGAATPLLSPTVFNDKEGWVAPGLDKAFMPTKAGLYRLRTADGRTSMVAVNAAAPESPSDADESADAIAPASNLGLPALWWLLVGGGLVIIAGEFALFVLHGKGLALGRRHPRAAQNRLMAAALGLAGILALAALFNAPLPQLSKSRQIVIAATEQEAQALAGGRPDVGTISMGLGGRPGGNAGDALMLAAASVAPGENGRILLAWNGNETRGQIGEAVPILNARKIPVDVLVSPNATRLSVESVDAPARVYPGDAFTLIAMIDSDVAQRARIEILRDGVVIGTQEAELSSGTNRIEAIARSDEPGSQRYEIRVVDEASAPAAKNGVWVETSSPAKVLLLVGEDAAASAFADALDLQGLAVTPLPPSRAPASQDAWRNYDVVVLSDVPAAALAPRQQEQLETAVRNYGLGVVLLGGPNAFGPGGYYETPFEALSPLSSRVPRNAPKTAFVFVLDRSGSMQRDEGGADRLTIAKAATLNAAGLLNPQSQVGIVAFDTSAHTVLPLHEAGDEAAIRAALGQLDADGGTAAYPALADAVAMLEGVDLPKRHIVLISDGLTQPGDFPQLLARAREAGITVSAIAIGDAADPTSLSEIAKLGGGAFHWSRDFKALPGILAQEALLSETSPVKERTVQPQWIDRSNAFLKTAPDTIPAIAGYVDTTAKPRAHLHLATTDQDGNLVPLMASWRYGAGQVLALATQATGQWTKAWSAVPDYPRFWAQIVRGIAAGPVNGALRLTLEKAGDDVIARVESSEQPSVTYSGPSEGSVRLLPVAGGWEGRFPALSNGDYDVVVRAGENTDQARVHVAYPAALSRVGVNSEKAEAIAAATGGLVPPDGLSESPPATWRLASGWRIWTLLALAFFLISLALRYLPGLVANRTQSEIISPTLRRAA